MIEIEGTFDEDQQWRHSYMHMCNLVNIGSSVTRRFVNKSAQNCPNIAQNGALLNKTFFQRNFWSIFGKRVAKM
jgi:hypothetical protein